MRLRCCAIITTILVGGAAGANTLKPISCFNDITTPIQADTPYEARYVVQWHGVKAGESTHRLTAEAGVFHLESRTEPYFRLLPFRYYEHASFLLGNNTVTPIHYEYTKKEGKKNLAGNLFFDWEKSTVQPNKADEPNAWSLNLSPDVFDKLSHTIKMRQDLAAGKQSFSYQVVEDGTLNTLNFKLTEKRTLDTALGTVNTVILEHETARRRTLFYLAEDYGYLLLQLEQFKDHKPVGGGQILSLSLQG